jgi:hypothetical protein
MVIHSLVLAVECAFTLFFPRVVNHLLTSLQLISTRPFSLSFISSPSSTHSTVHVNSVRNLLQLKLKTTSTSTSTHVSIMVQFQEICEALSTSSLIGPIVVFLLVVLLTILSCYDGQRKDERETGS